MIFPHDQMLIMDYNRVVKDVLGLARNMFLTQVKDVFEMAPSTPRKPTAPRNFGMYFSGQWFRLQAKSGTFPADDPVESLDVAILQNNLLSTVLGIGDPRSDENIDFVGGIRGLEELEKRVDSGEWAVAFAL